MAGILPSTKGRGQNKENTAFFPPACVMACAGEWQAQQNQNGAWGIKNGFPFQLGGGGT